MTATFGRFGSALLLLVLVLIVLPIAGLLVIRRARPAQDHHGDDHDDDAREDAAGDEEDGDEGLAWIKTLSKDVKTGARTALIKFDPGFRQGKTVSTWPVDSYVLEWEMTCGNRTYGPDTFHYRPAGVEFGPTETKNGITRVIFSSDEKHKASKKEVFHQDMKVVPWNKSYSDPTGLERGAKDLRQDDVAGYSLLLHSSFKPYLRNLVGVGHVHDHAEEAFVTGHVLVVDGGYSAQ